MAQLHSWTGWEWGLEAGSWTHIFPAETPFPPTLSPAFRRSPPPQAQRSTRAIAKSRPQWTAHPDPETARTPDRPNSSLASVLQNRGQGNLGLRGPLATRLSPRVCVLRPQIRARAWSAAPERRAACWGAARAASARRNARSSPRACRSAARTAPPTVTNASCAPRAAAATWICASCTQAAVAVRGGGGGGGGGVTGVVGPLVQSAW